MRNIDEQAISWLIQEKEGLNPNEKKELENWLEIDPSHKKSYNSNKLLRQRFIELPNSMREKLIEKANKGVQKTRFIEKTKKFAIAASIFLCIGFGVDYYFIPTYSQSFVSIKDIQNTITLPDDSKIALDVHSNMNINYYKSSRDVELLEGRAVFYVEKDKQRPFIVKTKDIQIEVVGTAFEVSNFDDDININVKEGTVKVSFDKKYIYLNKGDKIDINKDKRLEASKVEVDYIATWETGFLNFNKIPLKEVLKEFSRYTDINVQFQDEKVSNTQITGNFAINDFDKFLLALPKIYSVKVDKNENNLRFSRK
ncbi:FecR family protein [Aliarcobacter lanthieri]|uniref:FecR family protein n=1 Tax=Aliarcobacter lanthieri TaxID=1355374 RepID=UPI003AA8F2B4